MAESPADYRGELEHLPCDWRFCRVGANKAPIGGANWYDNDQHSADDLLDLAQLPPAIGLLSGPASGCVVLDLDNPGWEEAFEDVTGHPITDLPPTISWTSGKPGRSGMAFTVDPEWWAHLANRAPYADEEGSTLFELRGDRHQAVILGTHPETGSYRWLPGRSPREIPEPPQAPDWLLFALKREPQPEAAAHAPTAQDSPRALAMLQSLPAAEFADYGKWLNIGMALHHTDPGLLSAWVDWCRPMPSFDEAECLRKWESFGAPSGRPVTISTLHHHAKEHGYLEPKGKAARGTLRSIDGGKAPRRPQQLSGGAAQLAEPDPEPLQHQAPAGEIQLQSKDSDWLPVVLHYAFNYPADTNWICIDNTLHRWDGTHYRPAPDATLLPGVTATLQTMFFQKTSNGEPIHHWDRPARAREAIQSLKDRVGATDDHDPDNAINLLNGVLSWTFDGPNLKATFAEHSKAHRFTYQLPYAYDPEADPTHLDRLLQSLDVADVTTLQRVLGSGLELSRFRAAKGRPRALLLLGDGENGKDTIRGALRQVLGARGMTGCTLTDFQQYDKGRKFPLAALRGSRINWSPENTRYARLEAIQSLKSAISGEELSWEQKNLPEQEFTPNAIFLFNCNEPPLMDGSQAAMQSRWHAIRFLKRYTSSPDPTDPNQLQADPRLKDDLGFIREHVCPAMLNWLIEGLRLAVAEGIDFRSNRDTIEAIRRQSSHLFDFAEESYYVADPYGEIPHRDVWQALEKWYERNQILHVSSDGRRSWNDREMQGDPPVRISRDLERRLRAVFPKLSSYKVPVTKTTMLRGIALS